MSPETSLGYVCYMKSLTGTLGTYILEQHLDSGGNGEVWCATGPSGNVAIKLLKTRGPKDAEPRFKREIEALHRLDKVSGVLPLLDAGVGPTTSQQPWFAMPLATVLPKQLGKAASVREICEAIGGIAGALARVHEMGIVHRDIKPNNLFWHEGNWCIGDFGLADFLDAEPLTAEGRKLGPMYYIAPEMLNAPQTADGKAADIYSLGKTFWVLLTGQNYPLPGAHDPTFAGAAIGSYRNEWHMLLDELIRRMTLLDPVRRPSAATVAKELEVLVKERPATTPPDSSTAFARLRAALVPHQTRHQIEANQQQLAQTNANWLWNSILDTASKIQNEIQIEIGQFDVPESWGYQSHMAGPRIEWQNARGCSFEAGSELTWRLGIGQKCQLLSNGNLMIVVGYEFDCFFNGHDANTMDNPQGWMKGGEAMNGTPSCNQLVDDLLAELRQNLPATLEQFSRLIEEAS